MNIKSIFSVISAVREYLFSTEKFGKKFQNINNVENLKTFIEERSAYVTQTTLYGYLKTRMGLKYTLMFSDDIFLQSVNKSKWNIFVEAVSDLTLYVVSFLLKSNKINQDDLNLEEIYRNILLKQISKGMPSELFDKSMLSFKRKLSLINLYNYFQEDPFKMSGLALYEWAPIADELKKLDKEIVLNSIKNKWNPVMTEFEKLSLNFKV